MREILWVIILLITPGLALSQTDNPSAKNSNGQTAANADRSTITGCLTKSKHDTYRLVDQKKVTNMVYSKSVQLDPYVGQFVTLIGNKSATPSTDEGTGRPTPHFTVLEVQTTSGKCK